MEEKLENILDICLEKLRQGASVDDCLRDYPQWADSLRELLQTARRICDAPKPQFSEEGIASCLVRLGGAVAYRRRTSILQKFRWLYLPPPALAGAIALILAITLIFWGAVNLSAGSLPGEPFYPIKLITEKVKFILTATREGKVELRLIYSEERLQELVRQLDKKKKLNPQLLTAMLNEANLALEDILSLPESERRIYIPKLKYLSEYHRHMLKDLREKVSSEQRKDLDNAIEMCTVRMKQMMKMGGHHMLMRR